MDDRTTPRVLAVLVVNDGARWLPAALEGLRAQDHPGLEVVAVDNGSGDGSREILLRHLDEQRVLVAERDLGFGQAISMALDAVPAADADHLLLVHDDCVLEPGAVRALVDALEQDPRLAVVGPKLVDWDDASRLQSVGWTVDVTGRADSGLEVDELDQGQRDQTQRTLYVSTAGMLVRRDVFEALGRFDRRYHLFRDDLDLCWRAWLAGHEVEVVPGAVARHVAGATNYRRLGQTAFLGPRYFAERNTLATLLKNYGWARLAYVIPLFFAVGVAKVLGFVATRRLSDAWQTVRAWLWNGYYVRRTLRLRRSVQAGRQRTDSELRALFGRVAPRARAYAEAIGHWIAGPELALDERPRRAPPAEPRTATRRLLTQARAHPVLATGLVLGVLGVAIALPLLGPGALRGGELAPWPASPRAFLSDYVASWHDASGAGSARSPSPAQAVLGLVQAATLGSAWLASRLVLLGVFPVAWVLALRASAAVSTRRLPRVAAATAYVLSPPALAAARTGDVGALATFVALPALVATYRSIMRTDRADPSHAWRATAAGALTAAVMIAFEPAAAVAFAAWIAIAVLVAGFLPVSRRARRDVALRVLVSGVGAFVLLTPWVAQLLRGALPEVGSTAGVVAAQPLWRWLLLAPELPGFTGVLGGVGLPVAGVLGLVFGFSRRPTSVAGLWLAALAGVYTAWALGRATAGGDGGLLAAWPGLALLVTAAALAGLLAVAFARAGAQLTLHDFGWRQLASLVTGTAVAVSLVAAVGTMLRDPWGSFAVGEPALPEFIPAQADGEGPFRVLVLADRDGTVAWDLTRGQGPTMAAYGTAREPALLDRVDATLQALVGEGDPGAAGRLALLNVRYVVVPPGGATEALDDALAAQLALEPQPVAAGEVYAVSGWLPRAAFLSGAAHQALLDRGELAAGRGVEPLERRDDGSYSLEVSQPGIVTFSDPVATGWVATHDGRELEPEQVAGVVGFEVSEPGTVVLAHGRGGRRDLAVTVQIVLVLLALSLMLRPPRFAREQMAGPDDARDPAPPTDRSFTPAAPPADAEQAAPQLLQKGGDR